MIYVIRHGKTDWNTEGRIQGSIETELNAEGIKQAENVKSQLSSTKIDFILSSPRKRCMETASIIAKDSAIPIIEIPELAERGFGEFEGKPKDKSYDWNEFWSWEANKQYVSAENVRDFYDRVSGFIGRVKKDYNGKNILIVTHAGVCAIIYCIINNIKPTGKLKIPGTQNCEITTYDLNEQERL